jgi:tetraacyldisaccharide 4'-kinase
LYDKGIYSVFLIKGPAITVGNITVGGTGKSPLIAYIAQLFEAEKPVILSRGYGRKTKGLIWANEQSSSAEIGDEPMMYWLKFNHQVPVVVSEKRKIGIQSIRAQFQDNLILLDDAFQHRAVKAGLQIVLMTYDRPIFNDAPFPAGNLRESSRGINRADIVIITKCPTTLSDQNKESFIQKIPLPPDQIFFSSIAYGKLIPLYHFEVKSYEQLILVTGIAQPAPLKRFLAEHASVESIEFPDHHDFTKNDIQKIQQKVANFVPQTCAIVITEKDAVKLSNWIDLFQSMAIPVLVQEMQPILDNEAKFKDILQNYVVRANEGSR